MASSQTSDPEQTPAWIAAYRRHIAALSASGPDLASAEQVAAEALQVVSSAVAKSRSAAERQAWEAMHVATYLALGAHAFQHGGVEQALPWYRQAYQVAQEAADVNLLLQVGLAEAGVLLKAGHPVQAAHRYGETAALAAAETQWPMCIESRRMEAYCYEAAGRPVRAWECGLCALEVAERLSADLRPHTTLPQVGRLLLRLSKQIDIPGNELAVRARLQALMGSGWEHGHA